jgi:hypothetical protein
MIANREKLSASSVHPLFMPAFAGRTLLRTNDRDSLRASDVCPSDYTVGGKAGLEGRLLGALRIMQMTDTDTIFRGEAMRYLAELMWNPDALLFNRWLDWRVINVRTLAVATGDDARRCEVRLILDDAGDLIGIKADDRRRQDGRVVTACPWFGRGGDFRTICGRRIPIRAEVGWLLDGIEFIYWRGRVESWSVS